MSRSYKKHCGDRESPANQNAEVVEYGRPISSKTIDLQEISHTEQELISNQHYCQSITRIRIHLVEEKDSTKLWMFFNSRPNIKFLEIKEYAIPLDKKKETLKFQPVELPSCFAQLKVLKLGLVSVVAPEGSMEESEELFDIPSTHWIMNLFVHCPSLHRLGYPAFTTENSFKQFFTHLHNFLKNANNNDQCLQNIDLERFSFEDLDDFKLQPEFLKFLTTCVKNGIKLLNFDINCLADGDEELQSQFIEGKLGECIKSIYSYITEGPIRFFSNENLPNLEGIKIKCDDDVKDEGDLNLTEDWPCLRSLNVDLEARSIYAPMSKFWIEIYTTLIAGQPRLQVQDLSLRVAVMEPVSVLMLLEAKSTNIRPIQGIKYIPFSMMIKTTHIADNFPNLRNLSMVGWNVKDDSLAYLWGRLPHLKSLTIDNCSTASDLAFIGENESYPAFLKLENLEKLNICLDNMPNVTDGFFEKVLTHMKLKEFALESKSKKVLKNVTKRGLAALLRGEFSESIEDFEIKASISGVDNDAIIRLRNKLLNRG